MEDSDRGPLPNTPTTHLIRQRANNRYGAVLSALYGFWESRSNTLGPSGTGVLRRDSYSIVSFESRPTVRQLQLCYYSYSWSLVLRLSYRTISTRVLTIFYL